VLTRLPPGQGGNPLAPAHPVPNPGPVQGVQDLNDVLRVHRPMVTLRRPYNQFPCPGPLPAMTMTPAARLTCWR
jgi:hypothetical protein